MNNDINSKGDNRIEQPKTAGEVGIDEAVKAAQESVKVRSEVKTAIDDSAPTLKEVIQTQATEDESPQAFNFTLKKILGGDILTTQTIRHQIGVFLLITAFLMVYIANRYSVQHDLIEIDKLQNELQDAKYKALSSSSQLTEKSRESHVLELLKHNKDSVLKIASQPPYIINVPKE